ncbi:MAG: PAS domain S-box protein [Desulfovibrio sp.]|nr:MAG: PAS domain S-box protein [Desulfovibrio sp.]
MAELPKHIDSLEPGQLRKELDEAKSRIAELEAQLEKPSLKDLLDFLPFPVHAHGKNNAIVFWNKECERLLGYDSDTILNARDADDLLYARSQDLRDRNEQRKRDGGESQVRIVSMTAKDGSRKTIAWSPAPGECPVKDWSSWEIGVDMTERFLAEQALAESEEKFRTLFSSLGDGVVIHDLHGPIHNANQAALALFGCSLDALTARSILDLHPPDVHGQIKDLCSSLSQNTPVRFETQFVRKDGSEFTGEVASILVMLEGKQLVQTIIRDVTHRRRAEQSLNESMLHFRSLFESTGTAMCTFADDGMILSCNSKFEELAQCSRSEIEGRMHWSDFVAPQDLARLKEYHVKRLSPGPDKPPKEYEFLFLDQKGGEHHAHVNIEVIPGTRERILSVVDVTDLKMAVASADQSRQLLEKTVDSLQEAVILVDAQTFMIQDANPAANDIFGLSLQEMQQSSSDILHSSSTDASEFRETMRQALDESGCFQLNHYTMRRAGGDTFPTHVTISPLMNDSGKPFALVMVIRDITQAQQHEQALRESNERYRTLSDAAFAGVVIHDKGVLLEANDRYYEMFGYSHEELLGQQILPLTLTPESMKTAEKNILAGSLEPYEIMGKSKDGAVFPLEIRARVMEYQGKTVRVSVITDTSERVQAEQALRQSADRLRRVVDLMPILIHAHDVEGNYIFWNKECERVLGYTVQEVIRNPLIRKRLYPDTQLREEVINRFHDQAKDFEDLTVPVHTKDGRIRYIAWTSRSYAASIPGWAAWETGVDVTEKRMAEEALAQLNRELEDRVAERTRDLGVKAMELEAANQQLQEMDELKTSMLSTVTHDLRTPLTSVLGFVKLIDRDFDKFFAPLAEDLGIVERARRITSNLRIVEAEGERLTRLVNDFLDLTRIEAGKAEFLDMNIDPAPLIRQAAESLRASLLEKPGVSFQLNAPESLPTLRIDPDRLLQVLTNLLGNAAKYTEQGHVTLDAAHEHGVLRIHVRDTGQGIHPKDLERIFEKFYRVSSDTLPGNGPGGTGMGLAICRHIVDRYGGRIWAESREFRGSTFTVELPLPTGAG